MPFVTVGWPHLTLGIFIFAICCSILNLIGNLSLSKAYQNAESSWLAPIDYSLSSICLYMGKIIFNTWPNNINLLGIFLIALGGIVIAYREKIRKVA